MIWLEIFGYFGTLLVLLSMMMTSVKKLRLVNMSGSVVSAIYAALSNTWPVVILNVGLFIINAVQLIRFNKVKRELIAVEADSRDANVKYFVDYYLDDIKLFFPSFDPDHTGERQAFVVYNETEAIGILIGEKNGNEVNVEIDYVSKKYRDRSVAKFLFNYLKEYGIKTIVASPSVPMHNDYLEAMGFEKMGEKMVKTL